MCTCIEFKTKDHYFGRNLDLEARFNECVVITPRNYEFVCKNKTTFHTKYALIGMATVVDDYPLYAEATNEAGLAMAGLYFPNNAHFFDEKQDKLNLTPYELIPYFLGQYKSVSEIKEDLLNLNITNIPFKENLPVTDLHWMISDENESIVIEQMQSGLKIHENPVGILTNNPPFDFHMTNLTQYLNITPNQATNRFSNKIDLTPFGQGMGSIGLPGDSSPTSRFIRATYKKLNSVCEDDEESSVTQFFHILNSVSMTKGDTITPKGLFDITTYSCCINTTKGIYYYTTYTNQQINVVKLNEYNSTSKELSIFTLNEKQNFNICN